MVRRTLEPDIFFVEPEPAPIKEPRAKPGSKRVHFTENGVVAACMNRFAQMLTRNWTKVNCAACLRPQIEAFNEMWDKPLEAIKHRKAVKRLAEAYGIKRKKGEKFKAFEIRVGKTTATIFEKRRAKEEQKRLKELDCISFTTLPLEQKHIQFPIEVDELYDKDDYDDYGYSYSEIVLDKSKYIEILRKLRKLIDLQLKNIKKQKRKVKKK
ncbi:MAG: hypothetical protein ACFFG0_11495 [Candidatus Thorarchaeota archaeon]